MKKKLFVLPNDNLGGAEQILKMIAQYYSDSTIEIHFLKRKTNDKWILNNPLIQIKYQNTNSEYIGALFYTCTTIFNSKKKYDYIFTSHVFVTGLIGIFIRLKLLQKEHFIGRESTLIFKRFKGFKLLLYKIMYQIGYPSLDLLICQTKQMKKELITHLPWIEKKINIKVISNPFLSNPIKSSGNVNIAFPFIVSAGRLIPEKGFDILITAFKEILQTYPTYRLIILGEGIERQNLEVQIKNLDLKNNVILQGHVSNVYPYFKAAKVCVVSSRTEGFPNVLLQMMSQNNHVVSTKCVDEIDTIPGISTVETENAINLSSVILESLNYQHSENSILFKSFLEERSIESFIKKIEEELQQ